MSKYQIIAGRLMHCKGCKEKVTLQFPIPISELCTIGQSFIADHAACTAKMLIKVQNRKRYRLHRQCREAGLTVIAKDRDVQGWDNAASPTELPPPAQKLLNEFQYNFQHSIQ